MQSTLRKKCKVVKPKGFDIIESDIDENTMQYLKQKKCDGNAVSFFAQARVETMGMKRKDSSEDADGSEQCTPFGGLQMTFKMKTCGLAAKKECLARRGKEHLAERKEVRRSIKGISKMLKKPPVWGGNRRKRPPKTVNVFTTATVNVLKLLSSYYSVLHY
uniref:40S ribosomal protein S6 n=1 Tax=Elaeophora elaphi TaxID=1147741 RepID=A0A0R3S491_9BILA